MERVAQRGMENIVLGNNPKRKIKIDEIKRRTEIMDITKKVSR